MKTLIVYEFFSLKIKWTAPFKDNDSLLKAIEDYSNRGFFCRVI